MTAPAVTYTAAEEKFTVTAEYTNDIRHDDEDLLFMEQKKMNNRRWLAVVFTLFMVFSLMAVPSFATDLNFVTNGGQGIYFPGSSFLMKGRISNQGIGVSGASAKVEIDINDQNVFIAVVQCDDAGYFTTGFHIPESASSGDEMVIRFNGEVRKTITLTSYSEISPDKYIHVIGATVPCSQNEGETAAMSETPEQIGITFDKNVNYYVNNNSSDEGLVYLGVNQVNADCFTLYQGETEIPVTVSLIEKEGFDSVDYYPAGESDQQKTQLRNVIYFQPSQQLKPDTEYRLVIDGALSANNNVWLNDDQTIYFKTAPEGAQGGNGSGSSSGSDSGSGSDTGNGGGQTDDTEDPDRGSDVDTVKRAWEIFDDVSASDWFAEDVDFAYQEGLFNGVSETEFVPGSSMTRAMFTTVLSRMSEESTAGFTSTFADVEKGSWYEPGVGWASARGIVKGMSDTTFEPSMHITREQIAVMLYNYEKYRNGETVLYGTTEIPSFNDGADISSWASEAVSWACSRGIITGYSDGSVRPHANATRAQAAAMMHRYE